LGPLKEGEGENYDSKVVEVVVTRVAGFWVEGCEFDKLGETRGERSQGNGLCEERCTCSYFLFYFIRTFKYILMVYRNDGSP